MLYENQKVIFELHGRRDLLSGFNPEKYEHRKYSYYDQFFMLIHLHIHLITTFKSINLFALHLLHFGIHEMDPGMLNHDNMSTTV